MRKTKFATAHYYHVLNRGNEKKVIFFERENYLFFLRRLKTALEKYGPKLVCSCLMPNHFHLILQETVEGAISGLVMSLQISYAKAINKRYNRVGHLFQGPFKNIHIDRDEYLLHLRATSISIPSRPGLCRMLRTGSTQAPVILSLYETHRTLTGFQTLSELESPVAESFNRTMVGLKCKKSGRSVVVVEVLIAL